MRKSGKRVQKLKVLRLAKSSFLKQEKAQTGIEYLLILAGVVVIVVIVGFLLKSIAQSSSETVADQA